MFMDDMAHRRYTAEFKANAVQLVMESGRSIASVSRELGVKYQSLYNWVVKLRKSGEVPVDEAEKDELTRLRREVKRLRMERDFLKKAVAFFAKPQE